MPRVIPPSVEHDDEYFWNGVAEHRLLLQECADCRTLRHPPLPMCGRCHSTAWTTRESAGTGTVHSWVVSRHPAAPTDEGRIVVLVQLDEGVRFVGNLVDTPVEAVVNEMAVCLTFREYDGVTLPQFVRAAAEGDPS